MQGIGFGNQPYLVYQHHDAGHPHIHMVTANIQADGQRIKMQLKASAIYNNPGLKILSKKFAQNEPLKHIHKLRVKNAIDLSFHIRNFTQRALLFFQRGSLYTFAKLRS